MTETPTLETAPKDPFRRVVLTIEGILGVCALVALIYTILAIVGIELHYLVLFAAVTVAVLGSLGILVWATVSGVRQAKPSAAPDGTAA